MVSPPALLVYPRVCPRGQCWDHSYLYYSSTFLIEMSPTHLFHCHADDTVIYCSAATPNQALCQLQLTFYNVQFTLFDLKLVQNRPSITSQGFEIETVSQYKDLGILIDDSLSFKPHIQQLVKKNWSWDLKTSHVSPLRHKSACCCHFHVNAGLRWCYIQGLDKKTETPGFTTQ